MRNPNAQYIARLLDSNKDFVELYEFYAPSTTTLIPANASKVFSESEVTWSGTTYLQQAKGRTDASGYITDRFDSVTVTLSNIDRTVGTWLSATNIKGYRLVIRRISRSVDNYSNVIFVGRCERPDETSNVQVTILAKQDLGNIDLSIPWGTVQANCPLDFKGAECLAGQALGAKNAAYQAASSCNKVYTGDCTTYANTSAYQGEIYRALLGSFKLKTKSFLIFPGKATKQWSSQNGSAFGQPVPLGFGRTQLQLLPLVYADTGQYVAGQSLIGEGELTAVLNLRNVSDGFLPTFQFSAIHRGKYGYDAEQTPSGFFASAGTKHSHRGYVEYTIKGNNPDTGDAAPNLVAVILWPKVPSWNGTNFSTTSFSVNPVDCTRWLLTEPRSLNYNSAWINDTESGKTADYCNNALYDASGGEDLFLSSEVNSNVGNDLIRYRSTGIIDTYFFRSLLGIDATTSQQQQATYNSFTAANPTGIAAKTYYRARYTANWQLTERIKVVEFLFKKLLPSFRGYLTTDESGKLNIKCERPQLTQYLRANSGVGATQLAVEDIEAWKALSVPKLYCLVGVWLGAAEPAEISTLTYSTVGNSVTLAAAGMGTITATASGATLSGATSSTPATATVTIGGTITAGNTVTVTIDGVANVYTINANDTTGTIAAMVATTINANATTNRYIKATWSTSTPTVVTISSKLGFLNLATPLTNTHAIADEVMHVHYLFSSGAGGPLTRANILKDSFKWPLANREEEYNQFVCTYTESKADFAETQLIENDYVKQATTNSPIKYEIDGSCVDNYHQANRLVVAARYKYGEDKFFVQLDSIGLAECLEVGDVITVNHANMPNLPWIPAIIEELRHKPDYSVSIIARRYKKEMFPDVAASTTISLETPITWPTNAPGQPTGLALTTPANGTIRGTFTFAIYPGTQQAIVQVKKAGSSVFVDVGERINVDASGGGTFEISGLPGGSTDVKVQPISSLGTLGTASATQTITVTGLNGTLYTFSTPALTWTINHNLGYNPRVELFDNSGTVIAGAVTNPTTNQSVATFVVAQAGSARVY